MTRLFVRKSLLALKRKSGGRKGLRSTRSYFLSLPSFLPWLYRPHQATRSGAGGQHAVAFLDRERDRRDGRGDDGHVAADSRQRNVQRLLDRLDVVDAQVVALFGREIL